MPYVGTLGIIAYIFEFVFVIILSLMLVDVWGADNRIILALLIALVVLHFILWIVNNWWRAPCYSMRHTALCDSECGLYLIMKSCPGDYATRTRDDLYQSNDQSHLIDSLVTGIYFLIMYALFVGLKGGSRVFENLHNDRDTDARDVMNFTISRILIMGLIGALGMVIRRLFDTRSDFLYRHLTAIFVDPAMGRNGPSGFLPIGSHLNAGKNTVRKHVGEEQPFDVTSM
jgi:hypothetical protein